MHILMSVLRAVFGLAICLPVRPGRMVLGWAAWTAVLSAAIAEPPSSSDVAVQRSSTIRLVMPNARDAGTIRLKLLEKSEESAPDQSRKSRAIKQTSWTEALHAHSSRSWDSSIDRADKSSGTLPASVAPHRKRLPQPSATSITIATSESTSTTQRRPSTHTAAVGDSPISKAPALNSMVRVSPDPVKVRATFRAVPGRLTLPNTVPSGIRRAAPSSIKGQIVDMDRPVKARQRTTSRGRSDDSGRTTPRDTGPLHDERPLLTVRAAPNKSIPESLTPPAKILVAMRQEQQPAVPPLAPVVERAVPPEAAQIPTIVGESSSRMGQFEVIDHSDELTVVYRRSKLLRTSVDIYRTAVVDESVCDVVQYTPREVSVIGKGQGATHVTFWFEDGSFRPVTYLVRVVPDPEVQERREDQFGLLEEHLAELFPESKVKLLVLSDKLIVKGQARDAAEAAQILTVIRGQAVGGRDLLSGTAASPVNREETNRTIAPIQVINMLQIPGVQQVALRVKIAELNRSAARSIGVDLDFNFSQGELLLRSLINAVSGGTASILGSFDGGDLEFGIHYLEEHGVIRMLSEPTLVTLSGRPATFLAGGEFAVPTTVGVGGAAAVTTDFRAYGAIISFLPVVIDKDLIRLEVSPEFSQISADNTVNGTPGLNTRAVTTTVEMREGQTLAIAGLLDESMEADKEGDLPWVSQIFGRRNVTKNETELIILVTPELMHPMEPEAVPPLPGFDVTEPTNCEFFLKGHIEGRPTQEYRSTIWPRLRRRYQAGGPAMISGPFGHGD